MKTLAKSLAGIVATMTLASAEENAVKPEAGSAAQAKLNGNLAGEEREFEIAPGIKMKFRWCPAGEFLMGSPKSEEGRDSRDEDQAKVTLSKGFWISQTEVTQSQWAAVTGSSPLDGIGPYGTPHPESRKGPNLPIVGVSWDDAQVFMEKLNATFGSKDGGKMSLPTEAQYEYAARAGETGMYPGGNLDEVAWHDGNSKGYTQPVGSKKANAWGLHDMNGNAWEWVQDAYFEELPGGIDPIVTEGDGNRVIRGGCWMKRGADLRLATRSLRAQSASQCLSIGIRIVRNSLPVETAKPAIEPETNGCNVSKITYQISSFEQVGPKSWISGAVAYNEVKRNDMNVHLQRAAALDERVQIDLAQMKIHFRGQGAKEVHPILSASKQLSPAVQTLISQALPSSVESSSDQTSNGITNTIGMKLVPITKGKLEMGQLVLDEGYRHKEPVHEVTITRDYYLGAFEVTQAQYLKVMGNNPSYFQGEMVECGDSSNHPVDKVSWDDAVEFCKRLSALPEEIAAGRVYRLPTEAEWEYACRAGNNAPFGFGGLELVNDYGWFSSNSKGKSHPVGKKEPNPWGLYDMHGNVMEWCNDWAGDYPASAVSDPTGPTEGYTRIIRGGAWLTPAVRGKSRDRGFNFPPSGTCMDYLGFRVALSAPEMRNDIVSTAVRAGSFKTLAAALVAAGLDATLMGDGPFTVFAPTDAAFAKLPTGTVEELLKAENKEKLEAILKFHVIPGQVNLSDALKSGKASTVLGEQVTIGFSDGKVRINDATLQTADLKASNGVIHVIDSVLLPPAPKNDIANVAKTNGNFNTLLAAVEAACLTELFEGNSPLTVFAPTDAAFKALPAGTVEALLKTENREKLKDILSLHVVKGKVSGGDALNVRSAKAANGGSLEFGIADGIFQVNGATIVTTDIQCDNGVIHVINAVLLPSEDKANSACAPSGKPAAPSGTTVMK